MNLELNEENIKQLLSNKNYSISEIRKFFHVKGEIQTELLSNIIIKLEEDAFIFEENNKYGLLGKRDDLIQGNIKINSYGEGYVGDVKIPKEYLDCTLDGDLVLVKKCFYTKNGKIEGTIEKIVKQKNGLIIANYENGNLIPYKNYFKYKIKLNKHDLNSIPNDSRIRIKINPTSNKGIVNAELINIIGHKDDVNLEEKTIAIESGFNINFPKEVEDEVNSITFDITEKDLKERTDLRNETIFTIDCNSTKDMDDAISIKKLDNGNFKLGVHIADVSYFVDEASKSYEEASKRGTSVYLNDTCIPMLHRILSNNICSLNPNEDRLTVTVSMEISEDGKVIDYDIFYSIINSKIKMSYDEVNKILEESTTIQQYEPFKKDLALLQELSKILNKAKFKRGYIPFSEKDVRTKYDKLGNPIDFSVSKQRTAETIIENCMLIANECIGNYFYNLNCPAIYRVHESPDDEKIHEILNFIATLGYKVKNVKNTSNPKIIQSVLKELSKEETFPILSDMLLKGMKKAGFSTLNIGHFGLALKKYIQFTSPIRRFADLVIHIMLRKIIENEIKPNQIEKIEESLQKSAEQSSIKERAADKAQLEALKMQMAEYMERHIGEYYNGYIISINNMGAIVKTINQIEGKVPLANIKGDYYITNFNKTSLLGKNSKETYSIGDKVRIKVKSASKENRNIEYEIKENLGKVKTLKKIS